MPTQYTNSQSVSYEATGSISRDITDVLHNITPDKTPFLNMFHVGADPTNLSPEWHKDKLRPPQENRRSELDTYTFKVVAGVGTDKNYVQFFREDGQVSDAMRKIEKTYQGKDELSRQKTIKIKELAKDMEFALMTSAVAAPEAPPIPASMGGVPYFMEDEVLAVTATAAAPSVFTTPTPHHLLTGEYIVFRPVPPAVLPAGLVANKRYYIRQDTVNPTTAFTVYEELEDAVKNINAISLAAPVAAGQLEILLNNVVDAGGVVFTAQMLSDAMEMAYYRGGDPTTAVMSPANKRRFSQIMHQISGYATNRNQTDIKIQEVINVYASDFGDITAMSHRDCTNKNIYLLDMNYWALRYFDRPHMVENLPKTGSYENFVISAAMTLEGSQPLASAMIKNIARP